MSPAAPHRCPVTGLDHAPDSLSCRPCVLEKRTLAVITDRQGRVNENLRPLRDHLIATLTVESINDWARLSTSARLIRGLANGDIEISHDALDQLRQDKHVRYAQHVRTLLVDAGLLEPRDEILQLFHQWCTTYLSTTSMSDRAVLEPFMRWHLGQKLQRKARQGPLRSPTTRLARQRVRAAHQFLTYLRTRDTTPQEVRQSILDDFVVSNPQTQPFLAGFLKWGAAHRVLPKLQLDIPRAVFPSAGLSETTYRQTIQRLETDTNLRLRSRTAGLLIGLYGQELTRVIALTSEDFYLDHTGLYVRLGATPVLLPPHVAALILEQQEAATPQHAPGHPRWLYPSPQTHHHLAPKTISADFGRHGIRATPLRNAALVNLAGQIPIGPLCDLTGIGPYAASRWANIAGATWSIYPQLRVTHTLSDKQDEG